MTGEQWMLTTEALTRATKQARIAEEKLEAIKKHAQDFGWVTHDEITKILEAED